MSTSSAAQAAAPTVVAPLPHVSTRGLSFYVLLLISGFCGISYEILYARVLGNLMGDQMVVSASILMTFLLGIGIGTRYAYRLWQHLWMIELGIGLCGLFFAFGTPLLDAALFQTSALTGRWMFGSIIACAVLLAIPSILIGCSLPLFAGYLSHLREGRVFAKAYTVYNLGAAATALAIEFWIVRTCGLTGALVGIALLNVFVAIALLQKFGQLRFERPTQVRHVEFPWNQKIAIVLVSIASAVFQLMMIKVAECLFGPFHETFALVLATVLLGIAVGSALTEIFRLGFDTVVLGALFGLAWFLWGFDTVTEWYAAYYPLASEEYVYSVLLKTGAIVALMGIPAAAFGATIPAMLQDQQDVARESGQLLFVSSIANAVGFLLMAFVLHRALSYGAITATIAGTAALGVVIRYGFQPKLLAATAVLVLAALGSQSKIWNEDLLYLGHTSFHSTDNLEESRNDLNGAQVFKGNQDIFAITTIDDEDFFFINGYISIPLSSPSERIVGAFSSIFAPRTDNALVLGVGSGATAGTVGQIFDQTTAIEINPVVLENLYRMSEYNFDIESNDRVEIIHDDAIHFVKTDQREKNSLIINTVTTPLYFSSSKLYTDDFLKQVRGRLTDDGVYVTWFDGRVGDEGLDIVLNTVRNNFKHCAVGCVKSAYFLLLCSDEPIRAHHPDIVSRNTTLAEHFHEQHDFNPDSFAYGLLCSDAYKLIRDRNTRLNTLNFAALEFEMTRLREDGIDRAVEQIVAEMNLADQRAALGEKMQWDASSLLLHIDEMLGDCDITERWYELVDERFPEALEQVRLAKLAGYAEQAKTLDTADAHFDYGFRLLELGEHQQAVEQFQRTLEIDSKYDNAHFNMGVCYEHLEQYDLAIKHFRGELKVGPDDDVPFRMGSVALKAKKFELAEMAFRGAIKINDDSENHYMLALALAGLGNAEESRAELTKALRLDPQNEKAREDLKRLLANSQ